MADQVRSFVFTMHNWTEDSLQAILNTFKDARYIIIGKEWGKSGQTKHLQGFIQLNKRITLKKIGGMFPWHVEKTMGTPEQAMLYCKKEGDFIEVGTLSSAETGSRNTESRWRVIVDMAKNGQFQLIEEQYPSEYLRCLRNLHMVRVEAMSPLSNEKKCLWLWGKPGTGKSRFAFDYDNMAYAKMANKWWDGYKDQKTIVLDDIGKDHRVLGYHLKRWTDRYPVIMEIKGTAIPCQYDTFIITSNYTIDDIWDSDQEMAEAIKRRFTVINVIGFEVTLEGIVWIKISFLLTYKLINKFNIFD